MSSSRTVRLRWASFAVLACAAVSAAQLGCQQAHEPAKLDAAAMEAERQKMIDISERERASAKN